VSHGAFGAPGGLAHGSGLLFVSQLVGNAGFFTAVLLLARGLGAEGRGSVAFFIVTAMVLARLSRVGVAEATMVVAARDAESRPVLLANLLLFATASSILMAGVAVSLLALAADRLPAGIDPAILPLIVVAAWAFALVEALNAFLLGCSRFAQRAIITAFSPWLYAVLVAITLLPGGLTVASAAAVWTVAHIAWALLLIVASFRRNRVARPDFALLLNSIRFGLRAWLGSLSNFLNFRIDQLLLAFIATEATLGIYAVAVNASEILLYLPEAAAGALVPLLARSSAQERSAHVLRSFRVLMAVTTLAVVVAALAGPTLLPLAFGTAFGDSVVPFLLLLPGAFGFAALRLFSNALVASGAPGLSSAGPLVSLGVGIALDLVLIPRFGASGAAAGASAAFIAGGITALAIYRSRQPFAIRGLAPRLGDLQPRALFQAGLDLSLPLVLPVRTGIARARSIRWRMRGTPVADKGLRIIYYHRVSDEPDELAVTRRRFREQMDYLASSGFRVVDTVTAATLVRSGEPVERVIGCSFDDGYLDIAEHALPILDHYGFHATVFIVTGVLDGVASLHWYDTQPPLLTWQDVVRLDLRSAFRFEAHSVTHPNLLELDLATARAEIRDSKLTLEAKLGRPVEAFCYPAGLFSRRDRDLVADAGYTSAVSCEPGLNVAETDPLMLRRIQIDARDSLLDFQAKLGGGHDQPLAVRAFYRRLRYGRNALWAARAQGPLS